MIGVCSKFKIKRKAEYLEVQPTIKEKGKTDCFALSHCQNIKTTTAYEKSLYQFSYPNIQ
jgi:hypothetical protein